MLLHAAVLPSPAACRRPARLLRPSCRDLKSKNVLMTRDGRAKISDVGTAALHSATFLSGALCRLPLEGPQGCAAAAAAGLLLLLRSAGLLPQPRALRGHHATWWQCAGRSPGLLAAAPPRANPLPPPTAHPLPLPLPPCI